MLVLSISTDVLYRFPDLVCETERAIDSCITNRYLVCVCVFLCLEP